MKVKMNNGEVKIWKIHMHGPCFDGLGMATVECPNCGILWDIEEIKNSKKCDCGTRFAK